MIEIIAVFILALPIIYFYAFYQGKKSYEDLQNKKSASQIQILNSIKKDTNALSDSELDARMQEWQRKAAKQQQKSV